MTKNEIIKLWKDNEVLVGAYLRESKYDSEELERTHGVYDISIRNFKGLLVPVIQYNLYFGSDVVFQYTTTTMLNYKQQSVNTLLKIERIFKEQSILSQ